MLWKHPDHEQREVRLAYCLNLHAAESFEEMLEGMQAVTLPLKKRLAEGRLFGVGMYLAAPLARHLARGEGAEDLARLTSFLREHQLDPFTFNAFPQGGFHAESLKERVFEPTWKEDHRVDYTLDVARIASRLHRELEREGSVSISTHTGMFGEALEEEDDLYLCAMNFVRVARRLARAEAAGNPQILLSLEPEPRASAGDTFAFRRFMESVLQWGGEVMSGEAGWSSGRAQEHLRQHLAICFDCCHSAVEFESPDLALREATAAGNSIGKLQYSNALRLENPLENELGRKHLFALDEPRYLHQITGASDPRDANEARFRARDLPELVALLESEAPERRDWESCSEWRCHFHVPVDLADLGPDSGLGTTQAQSDRLLDLALSVPSLWGRNELHLEIETYTWDVLPGSARGSGDLVDGLEREYRHTLARLENAGWQRA
jgi:hypothetical protein